METKALKLFVAENGQTEAGRLLGVTAPAISKALAANRDITVSVNPDGSVTAKETRAFPSRSADHVISHEAPQTLNQTIRPNPSANQSADNAGILSSTAQASS